MNGLVLVVDDDQAILNMYARMLRHDPWTVLTATNGDDAIRILRNEEIAVLLSDIRMPGMSGIDLLASAREIRPDAVRIAVSGFSDSDTLIQAINRGNVMSFLIKPVNDNKLRHEIRRALALYEQKKEMNAVVGDLEQRNKILAEEKERYQREAITDGLTGLATRRYFDERMEEEIRRASRYGGRFSIALIDVDRFKEINDTYGHPVGDAFLKNIAGILASSIRTSDIAARYGGDEFALLLLETEIPDAQIACARIRSAVDIATFDFKSREGSIPISISIGATVWAENDTPASMLRRADAALYLSKRNGKTKFSILTADEFEKGVGHESIKNDSLR